MKLWELRFYIRLGAKNWRDVKFLHNLLKEEKRL